MANRVQFKRNKVHLDIDDDRRTTTTTTCNSRRGADCQSKFPFGFIILRKESHHRRRTNKASGPHIRSIQHMCDCVCACVCVSASGKCVCLGVRLGGVVLGSPRVLWLEYVSERYLCGGQITKKQIEIKKTLSVKWRDSASVYMWFLYFSCVC